MCTSNENVIVWHTTPHLGVTEDQHTWSAANHFIPYHYTTTLEERITSCLLPSFLLSFLGIWPPVPGLRFPLQRFYMTFGSLLVSSLVSLPMKLRGQCQGLSSLLIQDSTWRLTAYVTLTSFFPSYLEIPFLWLNYASGFFLSVTWLTFDFKCCKNNTYPGPCNQVCLFIAIISGNCDVEVKLEYSQIGELSQVLFHI